MIFLRWSPEHCKPIRVDCTGDVVINIYNRFIRIRACKIVPKYINSRYVLKIICDCTTGDITRPRCKHVTRRWPDNRIRRVVKHHRLPRVYRYCFFYAFLFNKVNKNKVFVHAVIVVHFPNRKQDR